MKKLTRQEVYKKLQSNIKDLEKVNEAFTTDQIDAPEDHEDWRDPLSITLQKVVHIQLSWGGPADGYKITFDDHNRPVKGVYYWQDWGEYTEVELSDEEVDLILNAHYLHDLSVLTA